MFTDSWKRQCRRVQKLNDKLGEWAHQESLIREECKSKGLEGIANLEMLMVIGATGAVWASRLKSDEDHARSKPFIALAGAAFLVYRWRRLTRHFAVRIREGNWIGEYPSRLVKEARQNDRIPNAAYNQPTSDLTQTQEHTNRIQTSG